MYLGMRLRIWMAAVLVVTCVTVFGQENQFMQFVGKPYGTYHYALRDTLRTYYYAEKRDFALMWKALRQMRELPDALDDHQWELEADFFRECFSLENLGESPVMFKLRLLELLKKSQLWKNKVFEVRILRRLYDQLKAEGNPKWVSYARQLEKVLDKITEKEFPDVVDYKFRLGETYLEFQDYPRAEKYFMKVVHSPVIDDIQLIYVHARNNLGLIASRYYRDYDRSDAWFKSIVKFDMEYGIRELPDHWRGIVKGNLGHNQMERKNYEKAAVLMEDALQTMLNAHDYRYSFGLAAELASCYANLGRYDDALKLIRVAENCKLIADKEGSVVHKEDLLVAKSKYYAGIGDAQKSALYLDSAMEARKDWDNSHNLSLLYKEEREQSKREFVAKSIESRLNMTRYQVMVVIAVVFFLLLIVIVWLYARKRRQYHHLAVRAQAWAEEEQNHMETVRQETDEDGEMSDLKSVQTYIESSKCYQNTDLTLNYLARELGMNRTALSKIINLTGDSFTQFINKYRIREAIRLLRDHPEMNIGDIVFATGFNNRRSFNNVFKSLTNLTPTNFRANL